MIEAILILVAVWPFWLVATAAMIRSHRSWFPFTIICPIVFMVVALVLEEWLSPWGLVTAVALHLVLWLLVLIVWWKERREARGSEGHHLALGEQPGNKGPPGK